MRTFVAAFAKLFEALQKIFQAYENLFSTKRKTFFNEVKIFFQLLQKKCRMKNFRELLFVCFSCMYCLALG